MSDELADLFEFWAPSEIRNYVSNVRAGFDALDADFKSTNVLDSANAKAWNLLYANLKKFSDDVGFFASLTVSTVRTAESYAAQLVHWRGIYQSRLGKPPTGATVEIPAANHQASVNSMMLWVGGGLVAWVAVNAMQAFGPYRGGR